MRSHIAWAVLLAIGAGLFATGWSLRGNADVGCGDKRSNEHREQIAELREGYWDKRSNEYREQIGELQENLETARGELQSAIERYEKDLMARLNGVSRSAIERNTAQQALAQCKSDLAYFESDFETVLIEIGTPAVEVILVRLGDPSAYRVAYFIRSLRRMGTKARAALPRLRELAASADWSEHAERLAGAIRAIEGPDRDGN